MGYIEPSKDNNEDTIDFGDDQIDFGDDNASSGTPSTTNSNGDFVKIDQEECEINWDISEADEKSIEVKKENGKKVASGEDAHSVLLNTEFRNKFLNELIQVNFYGT